MVKFSSLPSVQAKLYRADSNGDYSQVGTIDVLLPQPFSVELRIVDETLIRKYRVFVDFDSDLRSQDQLEINGVKYRVTEVVPRQGNFVSYKEAIVELIR